MISDTDRAKAWMLGLGDALTETMPPEFHFALVLYSRDRPDQAALLSPDPPEHVAGVLEKLVDVIRSGGPPGVWRSEPDA